MFANTFQSGFVSIFYSVGSNPLQLWDKQVKNGHIRRVVDDEVRSLVLEISGTNVATTYITCPIKPRLSLGIKLPFLVMIIKNMKKYFTFEIQILDDKDMHRRFRVSNFQSTTKVRPFCTTMPIGLSNGWNQVQFNLADFTKRAYGSTYMETTRVQIHANVKIRRIYFSDVLYSDEELPNEYKLFLPIPGQRPSQSEKKQSVTSEKKQSKKFSQSEVSGAVKTTENEAELPSAAPPSPIETPTSPEPVTDSEVVAEPPSSTAEELLTEATTEETEPTTEPTEVAEPAGEEVASQAPADDAVAPIQTAGSQQEITQPLPEGQEQGDVASEAPSQGGEVAPPDAEEIPTQETSEPAPDAVEETAEAQPVEEAADPEATE